jgi:hypothetical protein
MHKGSKVNLSELDDIEIYKLLLEGSIANFPSGFWAGKSLFEARDVAVKLLRYLMDEELKFSEEDIKREVSKKFLIKYKLHTASKLFGRSAIRYIMIAFPERKFKPWQFQQHKVPMCYWTLRENRVEALKYVFEEELMWTIYDIKERLDWPIIYERGLASIHTYYPSLYEAVNAVYPGAVKAWELQHSEVPSYFWREKVNRKRAVSWLVSDKLKLKPSEAIIKLERKHFTQYGLATLFSNHYNCSVKRAVNEAFE